MLCRNDCPECGHPFADFGITAEHKDTDAIYRCVECDHRWEETHDDV